MGVAVAVLHSIVPLPNLQASGNGQIGISQNHCSGNTVSGNTLNGNMLEGITADNKADSAQVLVVHSILYFTNELHYTLLPLFLLFQMFCFSTAMLCLLARACDCRVAANCLSLLMLRCIMVRAPSLCFLPCFMGALQPVQCCQAS